MKAYLSSTFKDLEEHRKLAYRALRGLQIEVVAMEDYVATDERPVDRCLADVAAADLYVGLFAFRYGYIPKADNPNGRSVTELEYRHAASLGKPRLVFLVPPDASWPRQFDDAVTGEGDGGDRIRKLRDELTQDRMMAWFTTADQLQAAVAKSVGAWLLNQYGIPAGGSARPVPVVPHPRQLQYDLLLLHTGADSDCAAALVEAAKGVWQIKALSTGLVAASADELVELDRLVGSARSAAVLLSQSSLTKLEEHRARALRVLGLARDRTGVLLGVAREEIPADAVSWAPIDVVGPAPPADGEGFTGLANLLHTALIRRITIVDGPEVGLPVVVVAMTGSEAAGFFDDPPEPVAALLQHAGGPGALWTDRYGSSRAHWRPFADSGDTIEQILAGAVAGVNEASRLHARTIRLQPYPFEALVRDNLMMYPIYQGIARSGCLVVVDELSLFHENVRRFFEDSPLRDGAQVAIVTMSPLDPGAGPLQALLRKKLDGYLKEAAKRFGEVLDPLCELGIPERRRLDRWLRGSLPRAVDVLREAKQDPEKLREFAEELQTQASPAMSQLMAGERGLA